VYKCVNAIMARHAFRRCGVDARLFSLFLVLTWAHVLYVVSTSAYTSAGRSTRSAYTVVNGLNKYGRPASNVVCLLTRSQSLQDRLPTHVRRLSMTDYEHLHYDKDRLCQAGTTTAICCIFALASSLRSRNRFESIWV